MHQRVYTFSITRDVSFVDREAHINSLLSIVRAITQPRLAVWHCTSMVTKQGREFEYSLFGLKSPLVLPGRDLLETHKQLTQLLIPRLGEDIVVDLIPSPGVWNQSLDSLKRFLATEVIGDYSYVVSNLETYRPNEGLPLTRPTNSHDFHGYTLRYRGSSLGEVLVKLLGMPQVTNFSMMLSERESDVFVVTTTSEHVASFTVASGNPDVKKIESTRHYTNACNKHRELAIPILPGTSKKKAILASLIEFTKIETFYKSLERTETKTVYVSLGEGTSLRVEITD